MPRLPLPAGAVPLVRSIGPYALAAAGLVACAWLAYGWLQRAHASGAAVADEAVAQWETDGGVELPGQRAL